MLKSFKEKVDNEQKQMDKKYKKYKKESNVRNENAVNSMRDIFNRLLKSK